MARPKKLSSADMSLLNQAVVAFNTNQPLMVSKLAMKGLLEHPGGALVEFNETVTQPPDLIACRATHAGIQLLNAAPIQQSATQPATQPEGPQTPSEFILDDGIPIPPVKRGRTIGAKKYPFELMGVGQSFHIPTSESNPKPSKRIAAVVSNASKALAPKKFRVQAVDASDSKGVGARVWRLV